VSDLYLDDGTRLSYQVQGQGPALVLSNGLTTNTEFWKNVLPDWVRDHTVLTWDLPGHGRSSPARTPQSASVEAQANFVMQLMAACGIEHAVQVGWSTGCQIVLETYRRFPRACDALVLILGPAGRVLDTTRLPLGSTTIHRLARFAPRPLFAATYRALGLCTRLPFTPALARAFGLVSPLAQPDDVRRVLAHIPSVDPRTLQTMLASLAEHEAADVLIDARVPAMLVAGDKDPFAPSELVGLPLHHAAPRTELLRLPEGTHTALLDHAEQIAQAVMRFVARGPLHA
jgi:pimeloyl-ACP methyl ester carboxylesterase